MSIKKSNPVPKTNLNQQPECAMRALIRSYVTRQCKWEHPKSTEKALEARIEKQIASLFA